MQCATRQPCDFWHLIIFFYYKIFFIIKLLLPHYKNLETREERKITYDPIIPIKSLFAFGALSTFLQGSPDVVNGPYVCSLFAPHLFWKGFAAAYINSYHQADNSMWTYSLQSQPDLLSSQFLNYGFHPLIIEVETFAPSWITLPRFQHSFPLIILLLPLSHICPSHPHQNCHHLWSSSLLPTYIPKQLQCFSDSFLCLYFLSYPLSCAAKLFPSLSLLSLTHRWKTIYLTVWQSIFSRWKILKMYNLSPVNLSCLSVTISPRETFAVILFTQN